MPISEEEIRSARHWTAQLRESSTLEWQRVRARLRDEGHEPGRVVLVDYGSIGGSSDGGFLVTEDGPIYQFWVDSQEFVADWPAGNWRDDREIGHWVEVTVDEWPAFEATFEMARDLLREAEDD